MTVEEARATLSRGDRIRIVVGEDPQDPTLVVYLEDGMVISSAVAGWSAGVVEPVCALDSEYLREFVEGGPSMYGGELVHRHSVEVLAAQ